MSGVSVRISGKRGKVVVESKDATTVGEAVAYAAEALGLTDYNVNDAKLMVDGQPAAASDEIVEGTKVDAAPPARLG